MKYRHSIVRISRWATGMILISLSSGAAAESQSHTRFEMQLRAGIIESLARSHFKSECFMAENGLNAIVNGQFDSENNIALDTMYYFDRECSSDAGMTDSYRGRLQAHGRNLNTFRLDGFGSITIVRGVTTITFLRGTETVHLIRQEKQ